MESESLHLASKAFENDSCVVRDFRSRKSQSNSERILKRLGVKSRIYVLLSHQTHSTPLRFCCPFLICLPTLAPFVSIPLPSSQNPNQSDKLRGQTVRCKAANKPVAALFASCQSKNVAVWVCLSDSSFQIVFEGVMNATLWCN